VKTARLEATAGITGDMWLGALVDAGASLEAIEQAVATLGIGDVRVSYARVLRDGHDAVLLRIRPPEQTPSVNTIAQVRALLRFAAVQETVRQRALVVFDLLAEAVAHTQGVKEADLRFNEVRMLDDLGAIVGACVGLDDLGVETILVGPVGLTVDEPRSERRQTVEHLLGGFRTEPVAGDASLVSPVGAALVAALGSPLGAAPALTPTTLGVGAPARERADLGAGLLLLTIGMAVSASPGA
jgi:uncharacterized protein (DUF111 family)